MDWPDARCHPGFQCRFSSIKFSLFEIGSAEALTSIAKGEIDGIGSSPHFVGKDAKGKIIGEQRWDKGIVT
jgi:acetate kinase